MEDSRLIVNQGQWNQEENVLAAAREVEGPGSVAKHPQRYLRLQRMGIGQAFGRGYMVMSRRAPGDHF